MVYLTRRGVSKHIYTRTPPCETHAMYIWCVDTQAGVRTHERTCGKGTARQAEVRSAAEQQQQAVAGATFL